ncbi:Reverse transcriptase, RNA-dependent DNA polymerase [Cucumis melo var. makuwa]|uniref:Reverse transcriptase, RNA-dependent DNA polymerase n=1 Tax=Cucumis melo var. makuwa TaxID=1194695 RepID=A0A5A7V1E0_CUCMM|nr:Reverse transcriptase, RNA-dependent DNA polymerase [Cucumis melo var. makuwa]
MANAVSLVEFLTTNFSNPPLNQLLNQLSSVKLDRGNYLLWKTLALPIMKSYKFEGHLTGENPCPPKFITNQIGESQSEIDGTAEATDGASSRSTATKTVNPKFDQWLTSYLLLLGWIYNSMTAEVAFQLKGHTFQTTRKGNSKMEDYLHIMKTNADNLSQNATVNMVQNRANNDARQPGNSYPHNSNSSNGNGQQVVTTSITRAVVVVAEEEINQRVKAVIDSNWYVDSGATNHVTADYSNLSNASEYSGIEHVIVGNAQDNNVYLEFHGDHYFVKAKDTG